MFTEAIRELRAGLDFHTALKNSHTMANLKYSPGADSETSFYTASDSIDEEGLDEGVAFCSPATHR